MVEVVLVEARDLLAADWGGTSDPYVSVRYGQTKKRTKVVALELLLFPFCIRFFCSYSLSSVCPIRVHDLRHSYRLSTRR
jgi:hypothetical protein